MICHFCGARVNSICRRRGGKDAVSERIVCVCRFARFLSMIKKRSLVYGKHTSLQIFSCLQPQLSDVLRGIVRVRSLVDPITILRTMLFSFPEKNFFEWGGGWGISQCVSRTNGRNRKKKKKKKLTEENNKTKRTKKSFVFWRTEMISWSEGGRRCSHDSRSSCPSNQHIQPECSSADIERNFAFPRKVRPASTSSF